MRRSRLEYGRVRFKGLRLTPPAAAHSRAAGRAHRVEVLRTLCSLAAHFLLVLQFRLRIGDRLPATSAVARPVAALSIVAVYRAVLARIDVVLPGGDAGIGVCVVDEPASIGRAL